MLNFIPMKCPNCKADLSIEEGRETAFCTYCGTKIIISDENKKEFTYRHIDEAEIKHAETEQMLKLKQMEMAEQKRIDNLKTRSLKIKASIILAVVGVLMMALGGASIISLLGFFPILAIGFIWTMGNKEEEGADFEGRVKVPSLISDYEKKNYSSIEAILRSAGFTNIQCVPLNDLSLGLLKKPGTVSSITINGHEVTDGGKLFPQEAAVVISYHSMSN